MRSRRRQRRLPVHDTAWHDEQMAQSGVRYPSGWSQSFDEFHAGASARMADHDARSTEDRLAAQQRGY